MSVFVYLVVHGTAPVPLVKSIYPTFERALQDKRWALALDPLLDIRISSVELPIGTDIAFTDEGVFSSMWGENHPDSPAWG